VLGTFARKVFPQTDWFAKIGEEILMESTFYREIIEKGIEEGERGVLAKLMRRKLGKGERAAALIAAVPDCSDAVLDKIGTLLVSSKPKASS